jgi:hypothetical protein
MSWPTNSAVTPPAPCAPSPLLPCRLCGHHSTDAPDELCIPCKNMLNQVEGKETQE